MLPKLNRYIKFGALIAFPNIISNISYCIECYT